MFTVDTRALPWSLHDDPEHPIDEHARMCACVTCESAIHAQAMRTPRTPIALKTRSDRIVVTLEYLSEVMRADRTLAPLLYVADDHVRELYVPVDWWMLKPRRWWSMTCHDDETAAGRRHPRHRVAKRQSRAAARRRLERVARDAPPAARPIDRQPLAPAVAPWRQRHRRLVDDVRERGLAAGVPIEADVVALVVAAREWAARGVERPLGGCWVRRDVIRLLSSDVFNWCSLHQVEHPDGVPEAVWHLLDALAATGELSPDSDPLDELRKPLRCYGGLDASGHARPLDDPSDRRCECWVTYRGPTHGQLQAARSAETAS